MHPSTRCWILYQNSKLVQMFTPSAIPQTCRREFTIEKNLIGPKFRPMQGWSTNSTNGPRECFHNKRSQFLCPVLMHTADNNFTENDHYSISYKNGYIGQKKDDLSLQSLSRSCRYHRERERRERVRVIHRRL